MDIVGNSRLMIRFFRACALQNLTHPHDALEGGRLCRNRHAGAAWHFLTFHLNRCSEMCAYSLTEHSSLIFKYLIPSDSVCLGQGVDVACLTSSHLRLRHWRPHFEKQSFRDSFVLSNQLSPRIVFLQITWLWEPLQSQPRRLLHQNL